MKRIEIDQRSGLWREWRKSGIGASECAAVLGLSKYKSPHEVWEEKTDRGFPTVINEDMQRGIDNEDEAREAFSKKVGNIFLPMCGEHEKHSFILASFDGVSLLGKEIVEIKCPRTPKLLNILFDKDLDKLKEEYLEYYYQVQHQLLVNDRADKAYLAAYLNDEIEYIEIYRDEKVIAEIEEQIVKFWNDYVLTDKEPELGTLDYAYCDDDKAIELTLNILEREEFIKREQASVKEMRQQLIDNYCDDGNMIIGTVAKLKRVDSTRVDYKKACEDHNINVEPYKKTTIGFYRLTAIK